VPGIRSDATKLEERLIMMEMAMMAVSHTATTDPEAFIEPDFLKGGRVHFPTCYKA